MSPTASRRGREWRKVVVSLIALWRVGNPRHSSARQSRNPIVLVLVLVPDRPDYHDEDEDDLPPEPAGKDACPTPNTYLPEGEGQGFAPELSRTGEGKRLFDSRRVLPIQGTPQYAPLLEISVSLSGDAFQRLEQPIIVRPAAVHEIIKIFRAQQRVHPGKEIPPLPDEKFEPPPFAGMNQGDVQNQFGQLANLLPGRRAQGPQPCHVFGRDVGLPEKAVQLVQILNPIPLSARQALAIFADVAAMSVPGEPFIGPDPPADVTKATHGSDPARARVRNTPRFGAWDSR